MSNYKRNYTHQSWKLLGRRPAVPGANIYLIPVHANNHGKMQRVFDWMRSGEWLSTILANELWKVSAHELRFYIRQLERRGYEVESEVLAVGKGFYYTTYTQYRLTTWEPTRRTP